MKNRILGLCLALLPSTLFSQTSPSLPPQEVLHSFLQEHQVPGLAVALIDEGKVMETQYLGTGMPGHSIDESTFFNTASLTKSITAFLTLQLIENGTLSLEEPLHPYWVDPDVVDDPRHQTLTPHILLSHQSGFANWRWMEEDEKLRFQFDPGTQFGYSGEGYEYLRRSLEAKQQSGFRSLVQENVFDPLHMENSHLSWVDEISEEQFAGEHKNLEEAYEITKSAPNAADDLIT
ncbi:MAG: serine hydrolase domain-containing protein, partial [Bacteroidota bacterium]